MILKYPNLGFTLVPFRNILLTIINIAPTCLLILIRVLLEYKLTSMVLWIMLTCTCKVTYSIECLLEDHHNKNNNNNNKKVSRF